MTSDAITAFLAPGLRAVSPDGRSVPAAEGVIVAEEHSKLLVFDLEMSGANPQMHEVLDIGGVRAGLAPKFAEEEAWGARVRPRHIGNAEPGALKVVGYSPKAWKAAIELEAAFDKFAELGPGAVLCGWGISGDIAFMTETCRRLGRPWPFSLLAVDIQGIARAHLTGSGAVDRFNLGHVADRLGIGRMGEHGALADAYATYDVLLALESRATEG